jgi:hypothetical protein
METFDLGFPDGHDRDRLSQSVEHLKDAPLLSTFWVGDVIDQRRHIPFLEAVLGEVAFQGDTLMKLHGP